MDVRVRCTRKAYRFSLQAGDRRAFASGLNHLGDLASEERNYSLAARSIGRVWPIFASLEIGGESPEHWPISGISRETRVIISWRIRDTVRASECSWS